MICCATLCYEKHKKCSLVIIGSSLKMSPFLGFSVLNHIEHISCTLLYTQQISSTDSEIFISIMHILELLRVNAVRLIS